MMTDEFYEETVLIFKPWLNNDLSDYGISFEELGLKKEAPNNVKEAYKKYLDYKEDMRKRNVK